MELRTVQQDVYLGNPCVYVPSVRIERKELSRLGPVEKWLAAKAVCDVDEDGVTMAVAAAEASFMPEPPVSFSLCCDTLPYSANVQAGFVLEALRLDTVSHIVTYADSARTVAEAVEGQTGTLAVDRNATGLIVGAAARRGAYDTARTDSFGAGALAISVGTRPAAWKLLAAGTCVRAEMGMQARRNGSLFEADQGLGKYADDSYAHLVGEALGEVQRFAARTGLDRIMLACSGLDGRLNAKCVARAGFPADALLAPDWCKGIGDLAALNPWVTLSFAAGTMSGGSIVALISYAPGSAVDVQLLCRTEQPAAVQGQYAVAIIRLAEGPQVVAQLVDIDPQQVTIGMKVHRVLRRIYTQEGVVRYGYKFAP